MSDRAKVAWSGLHKGEEPPLVGRYGSGMIFFTGCPLHCAYCQNRQISGSDGMNMGYDVTDEELADLMVAEIEEGIGKSGVKASAIGEFGTSKGRMTDMERKVFRSCAMAARRTGRLVTTHTTLGTLGIEQADYLISMGLDPSRIVIGHMDLSNDIPMMLSLLERGVSIGFDTVGKLDYASDSFRLEALRAIFDKGFQDQVVLSMDITRKSHLKANGGLGYSYLFTSFVPYLMANGFARQDVDRLLVDNPARLLGGDA